MLRLYEMDYNHRIHESFLIIFGIGRKPRTYSHRRQELQSPEMSIWLEKIDKNFSTMADRHSEESKTK